MINISMHGYKRSQRPKSHETQNTSFWRQNTAMAANEEVKVYGDGGSPLVTRAEIALKLKQVKYHYIYEYFLPSKSGIYVMDPVLLHNEKRIPESLAIVEYVDETWKGYPILPSDPYRRALARFWSKFIDDKVLPATFKAAWSPMGEKKEKGVKESLEALQILENELKDKFFNGDSIGLVDITGLFIAFWLPILQEGCEVELFSGDKFPELHKWSQEILNHPIVKEALPPRELIQLIYC